MKILIIRHADPDYSIDSLTKKGHKEAAFLAKKLSKLDIKSFYVSPLGRAQDTASYTLKKMNRTAETCLWLREFGVVIDRPDQKDKKNIPWDWLPQDISKYDELYDKNLWHENFIMKNGKVGEEYKWVTEELDKLLAKHGYIRNGKFYNAEKANNDTIVFFCHFGVECVLLSHLINTAPSVLWQGLCAAPSSVTTINTEERRKGIASFRISSFGDISHLYANDEPPAFSARFCECFDNKDERHD